jgi:DNA-binding FrmR family transcriptional regulator
LGTDEITRRDCEAILTQLMAARSALDQVGLLIADNFVQECLTDADGDVARDRVSRVLEMIFSRFSIPAVHDGAAPGDPDETGKEE